VTAFIAERHVPLWYEAVRLTRHFDIISGCSRVINYAQLRGDEVSGVRMRGEPSQRLDARFSRHPRSPASLDLGPYAMKANFWTGVQAVITFAPSFSLRHFLCIFCTVARRMKAQSAKHIQSLDRATKIKGTTTISKNYPQDPMGF
jgi:hypothetical protein